MKALKFLLLLLSTNVIAQKTFNLKDLFTVDTVVWYGIDYSKSKFIGEFGEKDLNEYFHGWNRLIIEEPYKYDVSRSLQKRKTMFDIESVEKLNQKSVPNIINVDGDTILRPSDFPMMVAAYQGKYNEGIGIVFIAEEYNRTKSFATHYVVIFDIVSKKILISRKYTTHPNGIGLRNYWAPAILESLNSLAKQYKKWKKKYA